MPRGRRPGWNISAADAKEFLQNLIREGKVLASDIGRFFEIRKLEERLAALRGHRARRGRGPSVPAAGDGRRRRRSSRLTPQQRASRKLQGRYLGLIRQIPASQRSRYSKIAKDKGRESAIREMQSALNK